MTPRTLASTLALASAPALVALAAASCSGPSEPSPADVEYHADVRPLLEANCVSCHHEGGPAPFSMEYDAAEWQDGAPAWVGSAVAAAEEGRMPPWLPGGDCKELAYSRALSDEEKATLVAWRDEGFPVGDPARYTPPSNADAPPDLGKPAIEVAPKEAYVPSTDEADDYRCFLLPIDFTEETYLVAASVVPDVESMVHHALLYSIPASGVATVEKLEAEDDLPGYRCFGGPGGGSLTTVGGWVPGSVIARTPADAATVLPAGSRLVLQLHYNTLQLAGAAPPPDRSTARLWTTKEKPAYRVESLPLAHLTMKIPAGEEASVQERVFEMPMDAAIVSVLPHMHLLGTSIDVAIEPAAGTEPACLIDIPRWDFHWQQAYVFPEGGWVQAKKGDRVRLRCTYDNSAANQPFVNGTKKMPEDITWGEGTLDEMCLFYLSAMVPYDAPDERCGAHPGCVAECPDGDGGCFFECAVLGGGQCASCLTPAVIKCAPPYCAGPGLGLQQCMKGCPDAESTCLFGQCAAEFDAFYACMQPHLENGDCAEQLKECGL